MENQQNHNYGIGALREREHVIGIVRHHWFVLFQQVFGIAILFIVPFFLIPIFWSIASQGGTVPTIPGGVVLFFGAFWALLMWNFLFSRWTDYYYDIWVITNMRVVDIDQQGLFRRNVATLLDLEHVQDVTFTLAGIFGNILNFGHVQVQTAAMHREFIIEDVPNPAKIVQILRDARAQIHHPAPLTPPTQ